MKKILSAVLSIMLLVSLFSVAFADSSIVPYASKVIHETTAAIRFADGKVYGGGQCGAGYASYVIDATTVAIRFENGKAYAGGQIKTVNTADKLGITSIVLYEKNGSSWTKLNSAYNKFGYNARSYGYTISAPAVEGRQYKVTVSFYGKIGNLTDTHTQSQTSTY